MNEGLPAIALYDPEPTGPEKEMYDRFVTEYLVDYSPVEAALRLGFNHSYATHYGPAFMLKAYVAKQIAIRKITPSQILTEDQRRSQELELIAQTYKENMQVGPRQVRVAAAKGLSQLRGFDQQPDKTADALENLVETFKKAAEVLPD